MISFWCTIQSFVIEDEKIKTILKEETKWRKEKNSKNSLLQSYKFRKKQTLVNWVRDGIFGGRSQAVLKTTRSWTRWRYWEITLIELRFDEIELVASLMCLYQSEVTLLLFRWQSKNWKIVYKSRRELWSKYEDMNRIYFLWHLLSSGITFWKAFPGILSPANFHNTYLILLFIAQIILCFNCLSFC